MIGTNTLAFFGYLVSDEEIQFSNVDVRSALASKSSASKSSSTGNFLTEVHGQIVDGKHRGCFIFFLTSVKVGKNFNFYGSR